MKILELGGEEEEEAAAVAASVVSVASAPPALDEDEDEDEDDDDDEEVEQADEKIGVEASGEGPTLLDEMVAAATVAKDQERAKKAAAQQEMDKSFGSGLGGSLKQSLKREAALRKGAVARVGALKDEANAAFASQSPAEALPLYTAALEACAGFEGKLGPGWFADAPKLLTNRALVLTKLGRLEEALQDADAALLLDKRWVKAYFRKATSLHALGRHAEAQRCFQAGASALGAGADAPLLKEFARLYPAEHELFAMPVLGRKERKPAGKGKGKENGSGGGNDSGLELPEVQKAMLQHLAEDGDWANEGLAARIQANPILARAVHNPRWSAIFGAIQANPVEAMQRFRDDPEAMVLVNETVKVIGEHFTAMGAAAEAESAGAQREREKAFIASNKPAIMTKEEAKMHKDVERVLGNDDIRDVLADPETQHVLKLCAKDPSELARRMQDPKWRQRFAIMRDNGLVRFEA